MKGRPCVSIVVPVYKAEAYLRRCLDSIRNQTLSDIECILVDDGSPDSSGSICDEYVAMDSRFSVLHLGNHGVSSARNAGIRQAKGDYVGFVDSDDWIEDNMYQTLYSDAVDSDSDVSVCGCFGETGKESRTILTGSQAIAAMYAPDCFKGYSCNKLVRRSLLERHLYNEDLRLYEDLDLFHRIFRECGRVVWHSVPLYHYESNDSSATHSYKLTEAKRKGLDELRKRASEETDPEVRESMERFFFCYYLETAIDYISNFDEGEDVLPGVLEGVRKGRRFLSGCTLRQRLWYRIVLNGSLKRLYLVYRRVRGS